MPPVFHIFYTFIRHLNRIGPMKPPNVFTYLDYRAYLKDVFRMRKESEPGFSVRSFARKAGMPPTSATLVSKVILGKRGLNPGLLFKFAKALDLKGDVLRYFEIMVQFNQAKETDVKNHFFAELSKFRTHQAKHLATDQFSIYDKWYYQVLRAYFGIHRDQNNPVTIGREIFPPLSPSDVEQAIRTLLDAKLIRRKANGYTVTEPHIVLPLGTGTKPSKAHIRQMTQLSLELLDEVPADSREYNSLTMYLSKGCFENIRDRIRSFREELKVLLDNDNGEDRIYTLSMQLFPNSRLPEASQSKAKSISLTRKD